MWFFRNLSQLFSNSKLHSKTWICFEKNVINVMFDFFFSQGCAILVSLFSTVCFPEYKGWYQMLFYLVLYLSRQVSSLTSVKIFQGEQLVLIKLVILESSLFFFLFFFFFEYLKTSEICVFGNQVSSKNSRFSLRILTGKKHPKIKFQCLRKIRIWTFGSLVHQTNSF